MTWWGLQWVHCWSPLCYISLPYLLIQHASEQWWSSQRPRRVGKDTALTMVGHEPALISNCRPQVCCTPYSITESHSLSHLTHSWTIASTGAFTLQCLRSHSRSNFCSTSFWYLPHNLCPPAYTLGNFHPHRILPVLCTPRQDMCWRCHHAVPPLHYSSRTSSQSPTLFTGNPASFPKSYTALIESLHKRYDTSVWVVLGTLEDSLGQLTLTGFYCFYCTDCRTNKNNASRYCTTVLEMAGSWATRFYKDLALQR